ncbi:ly6/PLAUR domain-containing protein 5 [Nematostella vectensis]|uniref:ly6/PLAUR domain-containing protein 5 n=1 Tax=Nematostella vectensis TaxID=45351 RepID=UPI00138FEE63|nr:ly6/PLAUR domain-containing protein 5 [Nematostella vectensis]
MKHQTALLCIVLISQLSVLTALQCFTCGSQFSPEDCRENQRPLACRPDQDRCFTGYMEIPKFDFKVYGKGCRKQSECEFGLPPECEISGAKCRAQCCESDSCNK